MNRWPTAVAGVRRQLVMFPPWQRHSVLPSSYRHGYDEANPSKMRVSWAFNLMVQPQTLRRRPGKRSSMDGARTSSGKVSPMSTLLEMDMVQEDVLDELLDEL